MSYQIYYDRQFIKVDEERFIPVTLDGSNNCYQVSYSSNRMKRERNFNCNTYFAPNIITTKEELEKIINDMRNRYAENYADYSDDQFCWYSCAKIRGRGHDFKAFKSFYLGGIKTAKTVEQLKEHSMYVYLSVYGGYNDENFVKYDKKDIGGIVSTTEELVALINRAKEYYANTPISFTVWIDGDERKLKNMRWKEKLQTKRDKESVEADHYFVVEVDGYGYLVKMTSRRMRYSPYYSGAAKYRTKKEVDRRVKALNKRYSRFTFSPVRVDEPNVFRV